MWTVLETILLGIIMLYGAVSIILFIYLDLTNLNHEYIHKFGKCYFNLSSLSLNHRDRERKFVFLSLSFENFHFQKLFKNMLKKRCW